jgi:glycogen operon protein
MIADFSRARTRSGSPLPLGANVSGNGVQFSIFSRHATSVTLVLFTGKDLSSSYHEIVLDPETNRTGDIWHIWIEGAREGLQYGYRIDGPYDPEKGHRFNRNKLLLDPYARAITDSFLWDLSRAKGIVLDSENETMSFSEEDSTHSSPRSIVINNQDIIEDRCLNIAPEESIIYEVHVKGFTFHESSGVEYPGTFRGLIEKIPYLKELGVTAVELLPVQEFDEFENINVNPLTGESS